MFGYSAVIPQRIQQLQSERSEFPTQLLKPFRFSSAAIVWVGQESSSVDSKKIIPGPANRLDSQTQPAMFERSPYSEVNLEFHDGMSFQDCRTLSLESLLGFDIPAVLATRDSEKSQKQRPKPDCARARTVQMVPSQENHAKNDTEFSMRIKRHQLHHFGTNPNRSDRNGK